MTPITDELGIATTTAPITPVSTADVAPFIIRLAGLPASVAFAFRSEHARDMLENIANISGELALLRAEASAKLFSAVPEVPPELRRSALAVKRDCFNGREIRRRDSTSMELLRPWVGSALAVVVEHERLLAALKESFEGLYAEERDRVRVLLLEVVEQGGIRRGLTLASPSLIENHRRLGRTSYVNYGRKERSAERSLARYVIRAAVKLSPYSTLTRLALGAAVPQASSWLNFLSGPWEQRSLVRLKSYVPGQWEALLLRFSPIRDGLQVGVNETLEDLGEGQHRLIRPWMLQWNPEKLDFRFVRPAVARFRLRGLMVEWLKERLRGGSVNFAELRRQGVADFGAEQEEVTAVLEQFLNIGILKLLPPWPTYEPYPEQRILVFLETSPTASDARLDPVRHLIHRLVVLEEGFAVADNAAASIREIEHLAGEIFEALISVVCPGSELRMEQGRQDIYEDVLMHIPLSTCHSLGGEILHMSRALADELFMAGNLLWRVRGLYERRHECLHAFWHVARELWPVGELVPCLRFFGAIESTWKLYMSHLASGGEGLFDPYALEAVRELGELRTSIVEELVRTLEPRNDGFHLTAASLRGLLTRIPVLYQATIRPCLIVQPADCTGELWVTHRLCDGTGRYSSRFSTLMPEPLRDWFTSHFTARSLLTVGGEPAELLDILFSQLTTINRHWPQTRRVLEIPGESAHLPADRVMSVADLFVEVGERSGVLRMRDRAGRLCLPGFLSALHTAWIPTLIKFLTVFGTDTRGRLDIPAPVERQGSLEVRPRLTVGRLVFRRKRWILPVDEIPRSTKSDAAAFAAVWNWRRARGLPECVFWIECLRSKVEGMQLFKPQFIDFSSPTLVALLLDGLEAIPEGDFVTFEEALPVPAAFPRDESGDCWGTELTLEGIAFEEPIHDERANEPRLTIVGRPH